MLLVQSHRLVIFFLKPWKAFVHYLALLHGILLHQMQLSPYHDHLLYRYRHRCHSPDLGHHHYQCHHLYHFHRQSRHHVRGRNPLRNYRQRYYLYVRHLFWLHLLHQEYLLQEMDLYSLQQPLFLPLLHQPIMV